MTILLTLMALGADPVSSGTATQVASSISASNLSIATSTGASASKRSGESANFLIRSPASGIDTDAFAQRCEAIRSELQKELFGSAEPPQWTPKCEIVLHPTRTQYLQTVGSGGSQTSGSANVGLNNGRVTKRRIDLLAAAGSESSPALRHELVHVLFADRFPTKAPPKWAEEGLALLSDSEEKQNRHRVDFRQAKQTHTTIPLDSLLGCANYPPGCDRPAFYGQSHAVVEHLVLRESPKRFIEFVQLAMETNPNSALNAVYGINGAAGLAEKLRIE